MLMFEHALESIKNETGQLLIPFESLKLTEDRLEKMFIKTAKKLQNKRPIRDVIFTVASPDGIKIDNALTVLALKYKIYEKWDRVVAPLERSKWWFDPATRTLRTLFAAPFNVVYLREYKMGYYLIQDTPAYCVDGEDEIEFFIKGDFKKGTLKIKKGNSIAEEISRAGNIVNIGGTLGTGTIDLANNFKVTLTLTDTTAGDIITEFYNKRIAIQDLDENDLAFHMWFTVDVLKSIGSLKYQATLSPETGLPFSLQSDTLLDRARQLEDELKEYLVKKAHWWNFGF